jgi:hypothetical protein
MALVAIAGCGWLRGLGSVGAVGLQNLLNFDERQTERPLPSSPAVSMTGWRTVVNERYWRCQTNSFELAVGNNGGLLPGNSLGFYGG